MIGGAWPRAPPWIRHWNQGRLVTASRSSCIRPGSEPGRIGNQPFRTSLWSTGNGNCELVCLHNIVRSYLLDLFGLFFCYWYRHRCYSLACLYSSCFSLHGFVVVTSGHPK